MATGTKESVSPKLQSQLQSTYSSNFPSLLASGQVSLLVTTYQAGQLVTIRHDGEGLNTHFCHFPNLMGLAANQSRLALGCSHTIHEFYNTPAVATRLKDQQLCKPDACYLPRHTHTTGKIDIHEMAWAGEELWFVNTLFSCLCTVEQGYSFRPRWRPPFITEFAAEDRCHLNGLELVNNRPKYVTALGASNTVQGWRESKADGGILIDIGTNQVICRGLSMPHSPRWYRNQLWVLESGKGSLVKVDTATGEVTTVANLPGFTRGLAFGGGLAFVGLSKMRETSILSELPIAKQGIERCCGVWVVDIETGKTVARLMFKGDVHEIFAVSILANTRYPEVIPHGHEVIPSSYAVSEHSWQQMMGGTASSFGLAT